MAKCLGYSSLCGSRQSLHAVVDGVVWYGVVNRKRLPKNGATARQARFFEKRQLNLSLFNAGAVLKSTATGFHGFSIPTMVQTTDELSTFFSCPCRTIITSLVIVVVTFLRKFTGCWSSHAIMFCSTDLNMIL
eukprot:scaffold34916_cov170-Amphora_coffeaeformis.AAC.13